MSVKIVGAILILVGCGSIGMMLSVSCLKEEYSIRELIRVLDFMECELRYRLTPLPELFSQAASMCNSGLQCFFRALSQELEEQLLPDVERCFCSVLAKHESLPSQTYMALQNLGSGMGRFDLDGQVKELLLVKQECKNALEELIRNKSSRIRTYRTLGICAGAALAILLF